MNEKDMSKHFIECVKEMRSFTSLLTSESIWSCFQPIGDVAVREVMLEETEVINLLAINVALLDAV